MSVRMRLGALGCALGARLEWARVRRAAPAGSGAELRTRAHTREHSARSACVRVHERDRRLVPKEHWAAVLIWTRIALVALWSVASLEALRKHTASGVDEERQIAEPVEQVGHENARQNASDVAEVTLSMHITSAPICIVWISNARRSTKAAGRRRGRLINRQGCLRKSEWRVRQLSVVMLSCTSSNRTERPCEVWD